MGGSHVKWLQFIKLTCNQVAICIGEYRIDTIDHSQMCCNLYCNIKYVREICA